jgi:hypothetical protein
MRGSGVFRRRVASVMLGAMALVGGACAVRDGDAISSPDVPDSAPSPSDDAMAQANIDAATDADAPVDAADAGACGDRAPVQLSQWQTCAGAAQNCTFTLPKPATDHTLIVATIVSRKYWSTPTGWNTAASVSGSGGNPPEVEWVHIAWVYDNPGFQNLPISTGSAAVVKIQLSEWQGPTSFDSSGAKNDGCPSTSTTCGTSLDVATNASPTGPFAISVFAEFPTGAYTPPPACWHNLGYSDTVGSVATTSDYSFVSSGVAPGSETNATTLSGRWLGAIATFK